jgi:DNA-directed RNA polymerase specialized sigma24 family protein
VRARRAARRPDPRRLESTAETSPALDAERRELLERLDASLERVPEAFRPVLVLRLRHELSVPEIAAVLGRPSGTVRSQLARGTEALRRTLPAGLAGALVALGVPTRGLEAVRAAVIAQASLHAPLSLATALGGVSP